MSIFTKLNTLLRAGVRETAEHITDANAIRIYRQEVVDAENLLARRRTSLASMIVTRKELEKEIAFAQQRIQSREGQISRLPSAERSGQLLLLTAKDIASTEAHLSALKQRHVEVAQRISTEELTLRKLLTEIREHRREVAILESQLKQSNRSDSEYYASTVSAQLTTLHETRAAITGSVAAADNAEASMDEAIARVDADPVERELAAMGRDDRSLHVDSVLARLKAIDSP